MVARYNSSGMQPLCFAAVSFLATSLLSQSPVQTVRPIYTILFAFDAQCSNLDCSAVEIILSHDLGGENPKINKI
jgi:hypothetical protein